MRKRILVCLLAGILCMGGCGKEQAVTEQSSADVIASESIKTETQETLGKDNGIGEIKGVEAIGKDKEEAESSKVETKESALETNEADNKKDKGNKAESSISGSASSSSAAQSGSSSKPTLTGTSQTAQSTKASQSSTKESSAAESSQSTPPSMPEPSQSAPSSTPEPSQSAPSSTPEPSQPQAHTHNFGSGSVTTAATCTSNGVKTYTCSCGEIRTESIPATRHQMTTESTAPTCTEAGHTKTYCTVCGYVESDTTSGAAAGHSFGEQYTIIAPTCSSPGLYNQRCNVCGYTIDGIILETEHSWDGGTVTRPATCTQMGQLTYNCVNCGFYRTEDIPFADCVWGEPDADGMRTCAVCGASTYD